MYKCISIGAVWVLTHVKTPKPTLLPYFFCVSVGYTSMTYYLSGGLLFFADFSAISITTSTNALLASGENNHSGSIENNQI